eukprot:scaffold891_cov274-Chaetoceros_neogracile.AAC.3
MNITPQQLVLGMDEMLLAIYGFLIGTNMNTIAEKIQMRLVSSRFKTCFITYLNSVPLELNYDTRSVPLKLNYTTRRAKGNDAIAQIIPFIQFMKKYEITALFELKINVLCIDLHELRDNFAGFDFSNLGVLELGITKLNSGRDSCSNRVLSVLSLFSNESSSVTNLKLFDNTISRPIAMYEDFQSCFPGLKLLDVDFGNPGVLNAADPDGATRASEECLQLEHLVRHNIFGDFLLHSKSLKVLDLSSCMCLTSIRLDCASLEELWCQNYIIIQEIGDLIIGGVSSTALAQEFGNSDRAFIHEYLEKVNNHIESSEIESISIIPSDAIRNSDDFHVGKDCRIILFTYNYE